MINEHVKAIFFFLHSRVYTVSTVCLGCIATDCFTASHGIRDPVIPSALEIWPTLVLAAPSQIE